MSAVQRQLCTFQLDSSLFGIDVSHVQEVLRYQDMTPVPLAPKTIRGLINLRGQIVTALDMRTRLGLPARSNLEPMNVVLRTPDGVVSLLVDDIGDVLQPDDHHFEAPPSNITPLLRDMLAGVYKLDSQLLLLLDVVALLAPEGDALAPPRPR